MPIELTTAADKYAFRRGDPIRMRMRDDGSLRLETWRDRWTSALAEHFWPSPKLVVTHIDRDRGTITLGRK